MDFSLFKKKAKKKKTERRNVSENKALTAWRCVFSPSASRDLKIEGFLSLSYLNGHSI